jgi:hypothetical protein
MPDTSHTGRHLFQQYTPDATIDGDPVAKIDPVTKTHTVEVNHTESSTTKTTDGHHVSFETDTESSDSASGEFDDRVKHLISDAERERQSIEDVRAVKRNRNRLYILGVVLAMELIIPTIIQATGWLLLSRYEVLAITAPDIALTVYAYMRRY